MNIKVYWLEEAIDSVLVSAVFTRKTKSSRIFWAYAKAVSRLFFFFAPGASNQNGCA